MAQTRSSWFARRHRFSIALSLLISGLLAVVASSAFAGKEHCRTVELGGAAGEASADIVVIRLVDEFGGTVLDTSCPVQVRPAETAKDFAERIPAYWQCIADSEVACPLSGCPDDSYVTSAYTKPSGLFKLPKKFCGDLDSNDGRSCKVKFIFKQNKKTGEVKKGPQLQICCKAGDQCKGPKWGKRAGESTPVNFQSQNSSRGPQFEPVSLPVGIGEDIDIVIDPISIRQLPSPGPTSCRVSLFKGVERLAKTVLKTLVGCHKDLMAGKLTADCSSINPASDPRSKVAREFEKLQRRIDQNCEQAGSPAKFAYKSCPAPCDIDVPFSPPVCVAGANLGSTCTTHSDCDGVAEPGSGRCQNTCVSGDVGSPCIDNLSCDSSPGSGDGACGRWDEVGECIGCLVETPIVTAVADIYGDPAPGSPLSTEEQRCMNELGVSFEEVVRRFFREMVRCQALADIGKLVVPAGSGQTNGPGQCRELDLTGSREKVLAKATAGIEKKCGGVDFLRLGSCATDLQGAVQCVLNDAIAAFSVIGTAAVPEAP